MEKVLGEAERAREHRRLADQAANESYPVAKQLLEARNALASTQDATEKTELKIRIGELQDELVEKDADSAWDESVPTSIILVEPATDPDDARTLKPFILQILGLATGIILAAFNDLRLFGSLVSSADVPATTDHLLTGLLIGGGSAPIHVLIRFVSERKVPTVRSSGEEQKEAAAQPTASSPEKPGQTAFPSLKGGGAPSIVTAPPGQVDGWLDIAYKGGVDPDVLESIHLRGNDPDLIVYHHTAMNSCSTFDDVVRVIQSRKDSRNTPWVTGYNCVVTYDGAIRPFCRWDRYGNHAAGFNRRSLGIAFNGNFENNPNVPYSNANGRYGTRQPSEEQLKSGARLIALWTLRDRRRLRSIDHPTPSDSQEGLPGLHVSLRRIEKVGGPLSHPLAVGRRSGPNRGLQTETLSLRLRRGNGSNRRPLGSHCFIHDRLGAQPGRRAAVRGS